MSRPGVDTLPDRPDHPIYREIAEDLAQADPTDRVRRMRAMAHADYWWYLRTITTLNGHRIGSPDHKMNGERWIDHPWLFDRAREVQRDIEDHATQIFYNWPRFHFKTTLVTQHSAGWQLLDDPTLTFAILTFKVENVGDAMLAGIRDEWLRNPLYHQLWPEIWPSDIKGYIVCAGERIKLPCTQAREPTVSVHSLDNMPVSFHVDRIFVDDAEVRETVNTAASIESMDENLKHITALQNESSTTVYTGTIWDEDGPWMRRVKRGTFNRRSHWTCFGLPEDRHKEIPCLQSPKMIDEWFRTMGDYVASCQLLGIPTARHRRSLLTEWLRYYETPPHLEAENKNVYGIVDFAGDGKGIDFFAAAIVGRGADDNLYVLDMWREKIGMIQGIELIFRLHALWEPENFLIEQYGPTGHLEALAAEQEKQKYRFDFCGLPQIKRPKENRIELYGQKQSQGKIWWPRGGFGHGSAMSEEPRDVFDQFMIDEYSRWTPIKGSTRTDDMLDVIAWAIQPEVWPLLRRPYMQSDDNPLSPTSRIEQLRRRDSDRETNWVW